MLIAPASLSVPEETVRELRETPWLGKSDWIKRF